MTCTPAVPHVFFVFRNQFIHYIFFGLERSKKKQARETDNRICRQFEVQVERWAAPKESCMLVLLPACLVACWNTGFLACLLSCSRAFLLSCFLSCLLPSSCASLLCFALLGLALLCMACFALLCLAWLGSALLCFAVLGSALLCFALLCRALLCPDMPCLLASGCILEHQIFRFAEMILCDRCSTSYDLTTIFFCGKRSTLDRWTAKKRKTYWHEIVGSALNCPSLKDVSQNCRVFGVVDFKK